MASKYPSLHHLRAIVETLNPYESPTLPATPAGGADPRERWQRRLEWLAGLQIFGVIALGIIAREIGRTGRIPSSLQGPLGVALALPATFAVGMMVLGPCLWLRVVFWRMPSGEQRLWWFVVLEPVLLALTLLALTP